MTSRFSAFLSNYLYVPMTGTPASLIPPMLDAEYTREVIDKLTELKDTIKGVADRMRT